MQASKASHTTIPVVLAPNAKVMAMAGRVGVMGRKHYSGSLFKGGINDGFFPGVSWLWCSSLQQSSIVCFTRSVQCGYTSRVLFSSIAMPAAAQVSPTELAFLFKPVGESAFGHEGFGVVRVPSWHYVADMVDAIKLKERNLAEVDAGCIRVRKLLANGEPGDELEVDTKIADAGLKEGQRLGFEVVVHRGKLSLCTISTVRYLFAY
jgi:hypothetical protein